jgi:Myb-like DNA-binding domain
MICVQNSSQDPPARDCSYSGKVDISLLLKSKDEDEARSNASAPASSRSTSVPTTTVASTTAESTPLSAAASVPSKRQTGAHTSEQPAKKQSKWTPEEDEKIIRLRGDAMKWEDISKQLPGRSAISCRLHYQNYLERRSEWDEDRKNKLARLYERYVEHCVTTAERTKLKHGGQIQASDVGTSRRGNVHPLESGGSHALATWRTGDGKESGRHAVFTVQHE